LKFREIRYSVPGYSPLRTSQSLDLFHIRGGVQSAPAHARPLSCKTLLLESRRWLVATSKTSHDVMAKVITVTELILLTGRRGQMKTTAAPARISISTYLTFQSIPSSTRLQIHILSSFRGDRFLSSEPSLMPLSLNVNNTILTTIAVTP
jgi:hypothetical protein